MTIDKLRRLSWQRVRIIPSDYKVYYPKLELHKILNFLRDLLWEMIKVEKLVEKILSV